MENQLMNIKEDALEGKAFQVMIDNNLDFDVALYPYELSYIWGDRSSISKLDAISTCKKILRSI